MGITALTNSLALAISESTGDVRVFSRGKVFMEIERRRKDLKESFGLDDIDGVLNADVTKDSPADEAA